MKKLISLLLVLAGLQTIAQKTRLDSLQAMPEKLFTKSSVLNCTVLGYHVAYVYRFMFSGNKNPVRARLMHEMGERDGYTLKLENEAFNKSWYSSKDVATYLQDWIFEIVPSHNTFKLSSWMEGVNPGGSTDMFYVHLPGGHFQIVKGLDTADYRHWKLFMEDKPIVSDSASVGEEILGVRFDQKEKEEDVYEPKNAIRLTVYTFWTKTEYFGIARWGNLFFPYYYGLRKKDEPQFKLSSIQMEH